jgi:plastocyanin
MMRQFLVGAVAALTAVPLVAAPLTVRVLDARGHPVADAVVTLRPDGGTHPAHVAGPYVMAQQNMQFHPFVLVVPVGATVSFPNRDSTKHDVYSFSPAKPFELKLFAKDQTRSVHFDKAGIVALGCNIHDQMTAFIVVTDSEWTAKTDGRGIVTFADAPGQPARLTVWHPYLRAPGNSVAKPIPAGDRGESFTVALRPPPMPMPAY